MADADVEFEQAHRECPDCHHDIVWARTKNAQWMPLDGEPNSKGNVALVPNPDSDRWPIADVIGRPATRAAMVAAGRKLYLHHRLSCPFADRWARTPGARIPTPPRSVLDAQRVDTEPVEQGLF